jgi:hypothetical protein
MTGLALTPSFRASTNSPITSVQTNWKRLLFFLHEREETRRNVAEHQAGIQHVVVIRKVVCGNKADTGSLLQFPVFLPDLLTCLPQFCKSNFACPIAFAGFLQFTPATNARIAQVVRSHTFNFLIINKSVKSSFELNT